MELKNVSKYIYMPSKKLCWPENKNNIFEAPPFCMTARELKTERSKRKMWHGMTLQEVDHNKPSSC